MNAYDLVRTHPCSANLFMFMILGRLWESSDIDSAALIIPIGSFVDPLQPENGPRLPSQGSVSQLWDYNSATWAGKFLDEWCRQVMRSRIEPMKKIARSLRDHREQILNYFRAQKLLSSGVVEGLNNKAKVTMRKSYGFRTFRCLELALYHSLGKLPEPESTHDFF